jgi:hypothetical protein
MRIDPKDSASWAELGGRDVPRETVVLIMPVVPFYTPLEAFRDLPTQGRSLAKPPYGSRISSPYPFGLEPTESCRFGSIRCLLPLLRFLSYPIPWQ